MYSGMMDPELLRLAQEQMSRISPEELAKIQQQMMSNPDLLRLASESMKNMRTEDIKRAAEQLKQTRPEEMVEITEKIAKAKPEEVAAMKAQADAHISYQISGAKMLKQQGNEFHSRGQYSDATTKYNLAKNNLKDIPSAAGQTLQLQCSLNLMSCYLKTGQFEECINEGSEVLTYDLSNVKAYYRRGQAYKELGMLEAAVADLNKAHEISPDDETIADVLRDANEKLTKEGGKRSLPKGPVIEEIVEEYTSAPSSSQASSSAGYSVVQLPDDAESSGKSVSLADASIDSDPLTSLRDDPATIRSYENYVSNSGPNNFSKLGMQGMSPELVKTATDMIGSMKPEELQKMFQIASSLNDKDSFGPKLGPNMPEMSPEMVKMASDMIGKMSPDELQNMLNMASPMGGNCKPSSTATTSSAPQISENSFQSTSASSRNIVEGNSDRILNNQRVGQSSSNAPTSTADMQGTMRNSMQDPAMHQMLSSMMKNMSPEMMANMTEQFGMKLSTEDAAKAQQAMASFSPEDLDRMMRWMERAQQGVKAVKKTKNWLLGRNGMILAILMLILAFILHQLGFFGG